MRASAPAAALAVLLATPVLAQDLGQAVTFARRPGLRFSAQADPAARGGLLFDSGASDPVAGQGGVILFHGASPDPGVKFYVGRLLPGGWAGWEAEMHRDPDGRFWARAKLPAGAGSVRIWAYDDGVRADHMVAIYGVELADEGGESLEVSTEPVRPPARPPVPGTPRPPLHGRAEWGARPPTEPYAPHASVWRITLHHSDGRRTRTLKESLAEAGFIQRFHQEGRGWIDIAYHFLVDEQGNVIEGRPESAQGAHTLDNNEGNIGICLLGNYQEAEGRPTPAQLDAVAAIARYLVLAYGIDPQVELKGHRDYRPTDCPGDNAHALLPALRRRADGLPAAAPAPRAPRVGGAAPPLLERPQSWDGQRQASRIAPPSATR